MQSLTRDLRYGARMLVKNPGFAIAAIITLALGIGANTAIFTVTSALLLRPFPYHDPKQLVTIDPKDSSRDVGGTLLRFELVRDNQKSFDGVAAWANDNFNLTGHGEPLQVPVGRVTPNFFTLLGVQPRLGRTFTDDEGRPEGRPVVVLSDALWRTRFNSDQNVINQTVTLDNTPYTIIGVLPPDVQYPFVGETDLWIPRYFEYSLIAAARLRMGVGYLQYFGRLKHGVTLQTADAELAVLNQRYREQNPTAPDSATSVVMAATPLRDLVVSDVRGKLTFTTIGGVLLLIAACINVASLLLSRSLARKREVAVRTALGASRANIILQLLTESTLLALIGGLIGIGLSWLLTRALVAWGSQWFPAGIPIEIDFRVLLFTVGISILTGIAFGLFPALQLSRMDLNVALREEGGRTSAGRGHLQLRGLLVAAQIAMSLALVVASGLLLRSFGRLLHVDPGFDANNVLTMNVSLPTVKYAKPEQQIAFFDELLRRTSAVPGVTKAAITAATPLTTKRITPVLPEGQPEVPLQQRPFVVIEAVSPQFLQTMKVPLQNGHEFTDADNAQAPKVVIANQTFARRFWPNENPIGKHIVVGRGPQPSEVVGVASDVKNKGLAVETQAQLYLPFTQLPWGNMNLLVRTSVSPESVASAIRAQVASLDADQPVTKIQTAEQLMNDARTQPRFYMLVFASFSVTAVLLVIIGIYGMLAYSVAQRRHELGIRMALGAERADILRLVVGQALTLAVIGIVIGLVLAMVVTRFMGTLLYAVGKYDVTTFFLVPILFLTVALLASYLPARRATKVDPLEAMRGS